MTDVVIWGVGGHALAVADVIRAMPECRLAGVLGELAWREQIRPSLRPLFLGDLGICAELRRRSVVHVVVGVGNNAARVAAAARLAEAGLEPFTAVHPQAWVSPTARLGVGTVVGPLAAVNALASTGAQCLVNTGAVVEHEVELGTGVHVSPRACLAGRVAIGDYTWIGAGTTVIDEVRIGARCLVGAGAVVVDNLPDAVVAYGVPARVRRPHEFQRP